jgi:Family of unknown function (DUF6325)
MDDISTVGPVEWVTLTFPGPALDPGVVPPLRALVDPGTVRLLDAAVLHKDAEGVLTETELENEGVRAFDSLDGDVLELLSEDDLTAIAAGLAPDTTTLVLVWENRWAAGFAEAVRGAGGVLAAYDRVPADRADAALRRPRLAGAPA